jgi:hypothetical protein
MTTTGSGILFVGPRVDALESVLPQARLWALLAAHVLLGLILRNSGGLSAIHALAVLGCGVYFALTKPGSSRPAVLAAYVCGAEVLWRMTKASIPWEFSKYAMVLILGSALVANRRARIHVAALIYVLLLLPAAPKTLEYGWTFAREMWSFNLSGPISLAVAAIYFHNSRFSRGELRQIFLGLLLPAISIASIASYGIATTPDIEFAGDSNFASSGGFGPNQVSAALGLAVFSTFLIVVQGVKPLGSAVVLGAALIGLIGQSMMTFSRGGLYGASMSAACASIFLLMSRAVRTRLLVSIPVAILGVLLIVLPQLDRMTQGALSARFADTGTSHRDELVHVDLKLWQQNPIWGVGPGVSGIAHRSHGLPAAAHTEYSRLAAEHGLLGIASMILLVAMWCYLLFSDRSNYRRALVVGMGIWAFSFMAANGMRLAAPSFAFGLCFAKIWNQVGAIRRNSIQSTQDEVAYAGAR